MSQSVFEIVTTTRNRRRWRTGLHLGIVAVILVAVPILLSGVVPGLRRGWFLGVSMLDINFMLIMLVAALALQVLIGRVGLISIGSAGFYALGAGLAGVFGIQLGLPFELVLVLNVISGAIVGAIVGLPSLKLKGLYAVLSTLAFHFIAIFLFMKYEGAFFSSTGVLYPKASIAGIALNSDVAWYAFLAVIVVATFAGAVNLTKGRQGLALLAVRDQELAARSSAVDTGRTKVIIFALTSSVTTLAGTLYVYYLSTATVELFTLTLAIQLIAIIVIGGMNTPGGAVVGVLVWTLLPKLIDTASDQFIRARGGSGWLTNNIDAINSGVFGVAIVLILVLHPAGVLDLWRLLTGSTTRALNRRRNFRSGE